MLGRIYLVFFIIIILGGTYNDIEGIEKVGMCKPCPTRKYCPQGMETDGYDCPAGFYCPGGQASGYLNACPKGTYSNSTGLNGKIKHVPLGMQSSFFAVPIPGPRCSKLTTALVNVSLKFQT